MGPAASSKPSRGARAGGAAGRHAEVLAEDLVDALAGALGALDGCPSRLLGVAAGQAGRLPGRGELPPQRLQPRGRLGELVAQAAEAGVTGLRALARLFGLAPGSGHLEGERLSLTAHGLELGAGAGHPSFDLLAQARECLVRAGLGGTEGMAQLDAERGEPGFASGGRLAQGVGVVRDGSESPVEVVACVAELRARRAELARASLGVRREPPEAV